MAIFFTVIGNLLFMSRGPSATLELAELRNRLALLESHLHPMNPPAPLPGQFLTQVETTKAVADPRKNTVYGGKGDASHLGGFTANDTMGQSPALWGWMLRNLNVRSVVDVGCGRGISTSWFKKHGGNRRYTTLSFYCPT